MRLARLAATAGLPTWVKLEIHPDPRYLLPDPVETLAAAEILVKEGFTVLPYINADPVLAKRLQDVGTATVMPLGSPIGSNRGIETRAQIEIIIEQATVPVVVDAGLGAPSQAAEAMEMGADAVLVNTAIAIAADPSRMAQAFRKAVEAGREAHEIGLAQAIRGASATSPLTGNFPTRQFIAPARRVRAAGRLRHPLLVQMLGSTFPVMSSEVACRAVAKAKAEDISYRLPGKSERLPDYASLRSE